MNNSNIIFYLSLLICLSTYVLADDVKVQESTPSPLADMVLIDDIKATTEKPPINKDTKVEVTQNNNLETPVHTVGDFIIHPLVAFRARPAVNPVETDAPEGKQAETATTTAAPWPVFGLGYGQAIGSSLSNVAGQISGWLNDRIQLPGLVDSPVRDSSTSTTTSTTPRPDVIVRVQHRPSISINNNKKRPNPVDLNDVEDYEQDESDFEDEEEENEDYGGDDIDEEEEEVEDIKPQRRPIRHQQRRPQPNRRQQIRRPINNKRQQQFNQFDDYAEDDSDDDYYYAPPFSTKRSQQNNFLNLGQQSLLNQIRLLTRGHTSPQSGDSMHKTSDRQQGTFFVRRNGQTVYLAPDLLRETEQEASPAYHLIAEEQTHQFPQPPLTKPLKVNGQIQQYITIPYNQLGLVPPQGASAVAEGLQSQPLILSIPQSALKQLQSKEKPTGQLITPNAVPLLTEASLGDLFKPPQIPASRTQVNSQSTKPLAATYTPLVVLTPNSGTKIRSNTIVEKSPTLNIKQVKTEEAYIIVNDDNEEEGRQAKHGARFYQLPKGGRFAVRNGRNLSQSQQELIPVEVIQENTQITPELAKTEKKSVLDSKPLESKTLVEHFQETQKIEEMKPALVPIASMPQI